MTNDLFGIAASGWIGTTINTILYKAYANRNIASNRAILAILLEVLTLRQ